MEWWLILSIIFGSLLLLLALGIPVAFAFLIINLAGAALLQGGARFVTGLIGNRNREGWKLALPMATAGIRGTDFFAVIRESVSYFKVNFGSISSVNGGGTAVFDAGQNAFADSATNVTKLISDSDLPAGLFSEVETISLTGSLSGPSTGAGTLAPDQ